MIYQEEFMIMFDASGGISQEEACREFIDEFIEGIRTIAESIHDMDDRFPLFTINASEPGRITIKKKSAYGCSFWIKVESERGEYESMEYNIGFQLPLKKKGDALIGLVGTKEKAYNIGPDSIVTATKYGKSNLKLYYYDKESKTHGGTVCIQVVITRSSLFLFAFQENRPVNILSFMGATDVLKEKNFLYLSNGKRKNPVSTKKDTIVTNAGKKFKDDTTWMKELLIADGFDKAVKWYVPDVYITMEPKLSHGREIVAQYVNLSNLKGEESYGIMAYLETALTGTAHMCILI